MRMPLFLPLFRFRGLPAACLLSLLLPASAADSLRFERFPADPALRLQVQQRFARQQVIARGRSGSLFGVFSQPLDPAERELLRYLYATMPLSDLADYDGSFFLEAVRATLAAQRDLAWAGRVPEDLFRHFVLPLRVNNENLDSFRARAFPELKQRVRHLSMAEAALEVNHWCHEKVTYQPSDARTGSPLSIMKTSWGRCGEESTFTVSALRAVAIPARQCYTPRWAHTDDNHAWVEVWVDGQWRFLGACEPEPELDRGWFREPSRRVMLVHTRAIGFGPFAEPVVESGPFCSVLNLTSGYAPTGAITVRVVDKRGLPVPAAEVQFLLYNSAELFPIATGLSGRDGTVRLAAGLGDLVVWAHRRERYGFRKLHVTKTTELELPLDRGPGEELTLDLDLEPPAAPAPRPVAPAGQEENRRRLEAEDAIRSAYMATFMDRGQAAVLAGEIGFPEPEVWEFIRKSAGNWGEIAAFLRSSPAGLRKWSLPLLTTLSEKDLRDTTAVILLDHLKAADPAGVKQLDPPLFVSSVLAPRVADEMLVAYRQLLKRMLPAPVARRAPRDPAVLHRWLAAWIVADVQSNYGRAPLSPPGALALRRADPLSRDILFVALCRTLGIPARLEPALRFPQYWERGGWRDAPFPPARREPAACGAKLENGGAEADPRYFVHFTLARIREGRLQTLEYDYDRKLADFPARLLLPAGDYLLLTGRRLDGGGVRTRLNVFHLAPNRPDRRLMVSVRRVGGEPAIRGNVDPSLRLQLPDGGSVTLGELAGPKGVALLWLAPGQEPSRHVVQDLAGRKEIFAAWGGAVAVLLPEGQAAPPEYAALPPQVIFVCEPTGALKRAIETAAGVVSSAPLPLVALCRANGELLFVSSGYSIGMGDRLRQAMQTLP
jgi:transglutaminase-like putative cysteine protease